MITEVLTGVGLTKEEVELYESLLEHGAQTAGSLAKTTKVQRTYIYKVTQSLLKKGLISISETKGTTLYRPQSPDHLLSQAEDMKAKATQAQKSLEGILPDLKSMFQAIDEKPTIKYFEGFEGLKKVYLDTIAEGKEILALVEPSQIEPQIHEWLMNDYVHLRKKHNIRARVIVGSSSETSVFIKRNEPEMRETRMISGKSYAFKHEINIYGSKLAIINHNKNSSLLGIIIDNPIISQTFKAWFELTWNQIR